MRRLRLFHFDIPTPHNYGDTLLFESVRNVFTGFAGGQAFEFYDRAPLRERVSPSLVNSINEQADAIVVGGGGLFLADTNPNPRSGWQWDISLEQLRRLKVPIIVFAVGNNRFIDQADFADPFREHLALTAEKSIFFGLRNHGSVATIAEYLPAGLKERVVYQPCPTTLAAHIYPDLARPVSSQRVLGVQQLVGKRQQRAGFSPADIGADTVAALTRLKADGWKINSVPFAGGDQHFDKVLTAHNLADEVTPLHGQGGRLLFSGLRHFPDLPVFFGTRGHAQMVPFGMGTMPVSVMVHNKLRWFAEDLDRPQWVIDPRTEDLATRLPVVINEAFENRVAERAHLSRVRTEMFQRTMTNLGSIYTSLTGEPAPKADFVGYAGRERRALGQSYVELLRRESMRLRLADANTDLERLRPASLSVAQRVAGGLRWRARRTLQKLRSR